MRTTALSLGKAQENGQKRMPSFVQKRHGRGATEARPGRPSLRPEGLVSVRKRILCAEPSSRRAVDSVRVTLAKG